jgi:hypothetical protein
VPSSAQASTRRDEDENVDVEPAASAGPRFPRAGLASAPFAAEQRTFSAENRTPPVIIDAELVGEAASAARAKQIVPTGEFDDAARTLKEQTTGKRDAAEALLEIPETVTPVEDLLEVDEDDDAQDERPRRHLAPEPSTVKFERADPTHDAPPDATQIETQRAKHPTGGTLRAAAALRRKRGLWGDVRYVATAVMGVQRSRRELAELEHRQNVRQTSRRHHLIILGRTAAVLESLDHPALGKSREQLAAIEDERSKHAGAVAASDAELERVRRDRENAMKQHAIAISETDAELAELAKKLEPVEKEAQVVRKRASDLRDELRRIEKQIADTEEKLATAKGDKVDRPAVQADIATFKANREAVMRDEPGIAAELDALNPRIAAMEATRAGLERKKADIV